jgi:hypothetical protein
MDKTVQKFSSFKEADEADFEYWAKKSPEEKIRVVLELRAVQNGGDETIEKCVRIFPMSELKKAT